MCTPLLLALGLALVTSSAPAQAQAQVQVQIHLDLPPILPPLVVIQPGVRVVQDFDEEVFFVGGYYWVARGDTWYRSRDHRGPWGSMKPKKVPAELTRLERGRYRRWQHDERRSWPDPKQAKHGELHWRPNDRVEAGRPPPPEAHQGGKKQGGKKQGKGHGGDGKEKGQGHEKGHDKD